MWGVLWMWARHVSKEWSCSSVQLLSCVQLFATPWTAAHQASLSIDNTWSLLNPSGHLGSGYGMCYQSFVYPGLWAPEHVPIMGLNFWWHKKDCFAKVLLVPMSVWEQWKGWGLRIYLVGAVLWYCQPAWLNHRPKALLGQCLQGEMQLTCG